MVELAPPLRSSAELWSVGRLVTPVEGIDIARSCNDVALWFQGNVDVSAVPVLQHGQISGLVERNAFFYRFLTGYGREVYSKRSIRELMYLEPLIVASNEQVNAVAVRITEESPEALQYGFIVADAGVCLGVVSGISLLRASAAQMAATLGEKQRVVVALQESENALRKAMHDADEANRSKSDFLANMSHEIRTPMNAIIGLSHLALKTELTPRQLDYLKKIQQSSQHLLGIINDILDFSKVEAGKLDIEMAPLDLHHVLDNVASLLAEKATAKGLELIFDVERDVPVHLIGDSLRLGQILINYANNAVKFTQQGEIRITVVKVEENDIQVFLRFEVKDTGIGVTQDQVARLFQSFQQADTSTSRKYGGTGLGLVISKNLAELMGGAVGVDSIPGQGSIFWFTARLGKGVAPTRRYFLQPDLRHSRMLVVDDNDAARTVLNGILENMGCDAEAVSSGTAAIAAIQKAIALQRPFEIVFLDWQMPDMNGLETARALQALRLDPMPNLVIVTAYGREDVLKGAQNAYIDNVLFKPVNSSILYDMVMDILGKDRYEGARQKEMSVTSLEAQLAHIAGARILLVEDNELNRQVALELLTDAGFIVDVAENGRQAVDRVQSQLPPYDIVLMDIQMQVMDGIMATCLLRSRSEYADLPILAMTANALQTDREKCLAAGMNAHISKPIAPDELWSGLLRWIRKREGLGRGLHRNSADTESTARRPNNSVPLDGERVIDRAQVREVCQRLRILLEEDDAEAAEIFADHSELLNAALGGKANEIAAHIAAFDLELALAALLQVMRQAGLNGESDE